MKIYKIKMKGGKTFWKDSKYGNASQVATDIKKSFWKK